MDFNSKFCDLNNFYLNGAIILRLSKRNVLISVRSYLNPNSSLSLSFCLSVWETSISLEIKSKCSCFLLPLAFILNSPLTGSNGRLFFQNWECDNEDRESISIYNMYSEDDFWAYEIVLMVILQSTFGISIIVPFYIWVIWFKMICLYFAEDMGLRANWTEPNWVEKKSIRSFWFQSRKHAWFSLGLYCFGSDFWSADWSSSLDTYQNLESICSFKEKFILLGDPNFKYYLGIVHNT